MFIFRCGAHWCAAVSGASREAIEDPRWQKSGEACNGEHEQYAVLLARVGVGARPAASPGAAQRDEQGVLLPQEKQAKQPSAGRRGEQALEILPALDRRAVDL